MMAGIITAMDTTGVDTDTAMADRLTIRQECGMGLEDLKALERKD